MEQDLVIFEMQAELCKVMGHAVRLRIVHILKDGPKCVTDLVNALVNVAQPTVSRHLSIFRSAGVLTTRRDGTEAIYEIANPRIIGVCETMRTILAERESQYNDLFDRIRNEKDQFNESN